MALQDHRLLLVTIKVTELLPCLSMEREVSWTSLEATEGPLLPARLGTIRCDSHPMWVAFFSVD